MIRYWVALIPLLLLQPGLAHAMKFSTSFTEFELPAGWACHLDELTWTCEATDESNQGDAVMVLAAKRKGEADTLAGIQMYLLKPRQVKNDKGEMVNSKSSYVRTTEINGQTWVDSLHVDSELSGYFTRYIATVKGEIEVLITYSIDKDKYELNVPLFEALVRSVKIFAPNENTPIPVKQAAAPQVLAPGINTTTMSKFPGDLKAATDAPVQKVKKTDEGGGNGLLWLLLAGAAGFYFYKKKKKEREEGN